MMGWLFYTDRRIHGHAQEKAEITRICTFENDTLSQSPVKLSKIGPVWYVAVKSQPKPGAVFSQTQYVADAEGSYTFAAVFLVSYDQGCFGYKDMDETMGPVQARAPLGLLACLSDLTDPDCYAQGWRKKCSAWAAIPSYLEGDEIQLAAPVKLSDGSTVQDVRRTHYKRRDRHMTCYANLKTGALIRLSKQSLAGSVLIKGAATAGSDVLAEFYARQNRG
jgi:hypothetical protein